MATRRKRVLIVDDEEDLTWTLSKKLSKDSDKFEVICVNSGREAIEVLNQLPVDLVITDVRMPEVSGLDLLVDIKRLYPDTKVTIMTAYGSPDVQQEASQRGCFDYIEKPFEINELRKRIIESLEQKRGFRGSIADFQLADIVQLNCLGRITSTLKVRGEGGEGTIYFRDGNVVHAEAGHLEGESAFFYMMSWSGGEFQVFRNMPPARETITRGWQSLLLESMRLLDESSDLAKEQAEREKRRRQHKLEQMLGKIFKTEGVEHILLHTRAGFPLFYTGNSPERLATMSELGNQLSKFIQKIEAQENSLDCGKLEYWEFHGEKRVVIIQRIPNRDAYLTVLGTPSLNAGFVRVEIKKNLQELVRLV